MYITIRQACNAVKSCFPSFRALNSLFRQPVGPSQLITEYQHTGDLVISFTTFKNTYDTDPQYLPTETDPGLLIDNFGW